MIADNPMAAVNNLPKIHQAEMLTLTPAQIARLAAHIDGRYRALVVVGCHSGLRFGELTALTAADVDLLRRRVTVTRNTVEVSGVLHHGRVKTRASWRTVPLSAEAVAALTPLVGGAAHPDDLLFTAPQGGFLRLASWRSRFWRPATTTAGLDGMRPHDMRHTAVSLWIAAGANPKEVAAWAGHRSVATVFDRYGHLMPDGADAFLDQLDTYMAKAK
jgi:integrase